MIIDKEKYNQETKKILDGYTGPDKKKLEVYLQDILVATNSEGNGRESSESIIMRTLEMIFKTPFANEPMIPLSFLETELGKAILSLKYADMEKSYTSAPERTYTVKDVAEIVNKTKQAIYKDIDKLIFPISPGNKTFYESEVKRYLKVKEVSLENLYKFNESK